MNVTMTHYPVDYQDSYYTSNFGKIDNNLDRVRKNLDYLEDMYEAKHDAGLFLPVSVLQTDNDSGEEKESRS